MAASSGLLATPALLWLEQSLPAAFRSCTGSPYQATPSPLSLRFRHVSAWIAPSAFSVTGSAGLRRGASACLCWPVNLPPHGSRTTVWASLRFHLRCRSAAASSGMPAKPLWNSGLHRTPWAPASCPRLPTSSTHSVTGGPFGSLDGLSVSASRLSSSRNPRL